MITSVKDKALLNVMLYRLEQSNNEYICVLCGHTMDIHPIECPNCHFKNK